MMTCLWNSADSIGVGDIASSMSIRKYRKNDIIYHEHESPSKLFFLVSGKVKIVKESGLGRAQIVRAVREKEFIGYRAFFANECYATSAMAFEDSTVACLPMGMLKEMMAKDSNVSAYFIRALSTALGTADWRIVSLTQKHIRGRLAQTILGLKDSYGYDCDNSTLSISMNRDDLASMANMSTSNAIRTLSAFAQEGILSVDGRRISILDEAKLAKISERG